VYNVAVEYEGRFEDGEVFDTSQHEGHSHPLVFVAGAGEVIPGFDNAVIGMKQGEEKEVTIQPKEAYGEYDARLTQEVPKTEFNLPRNQQPHVGMTLMMQSPHGDTIPVYVKAVGKDLVTLDLNAKRERRDPALLVSISVCPIAFVVVYPSNFFCVLACARDGSG
jgi:FKBP-type peptidyl-prolyl cis-trans isomerase 2